MRGTTLALLVGLGVAFATPGLADSATALQVRDKALADDTAWNLLQSLTSEIGPRPAGSPAAALARDWAVANMTALGFTNVHAEPFAKAAWLRDAESAEVVAPVPLKLALLGLGHSVPTPPGGITAEVVVLKSLAQLKSASADAFKGKIVLVNQAMTRTQDESGYAAAVAVRYGVSEAARRGAAAYLIRSIATGTGRAPHTGATLYADDAPKIAAAALGVPDADMLEYLAARGPVTVHLSLASHVLQATAWNISGDIAGRAPGPAIVVGGHIDSWDPGTGAIDDGAGVAITLAAAHLVGHPRHTIRVVLWGSEETGGAGAAYLDANKSELGAIALTSESDLGADRVYSLQVPAGAWAAPDIAPLETILAPLKIMASREPVRQGGADVSNMHEAGVPIFLLNQDANRYFDYHHTSDDTLAIVDPAQLRQNVAAWAATLSVLADSDFDFRKGGK